MSGLNMGIIKELPVRLPDVREQDSIVEKIAAVRSDIQNLEALYQQKVESLAELKQSILQKAFAGELTAQPVKVLGAALA